MPRFLLVAMAVLFGSGCGYVGEPLPPALHIPQRVTDLSAVQRGSEIEVAFTLPTHSTEGLALAKPGAIELRVGPAGAPIENWVSGARPFSDVPVSRPVVHYKVPAAEWTGKDLLIAVRVASPRGRDAGWSNLVTLSVVAPLARPDGLDAKAVPAGVRVTWRGSTPRYRVFRRTGEESSAAALAETDGPEYTDQSTEYGKIHRYSVEGIRTGGDVRAASTVSEEVTIIPEDKFPPAVPAGLAAIASTTTIELVWERGAEPDLAGYRIYRAVGAGQFEKIGETAEAPSYSDRKMEGGKTYRYAVSAFDKAGNESEMSTPVEIIAQ